MHPALIVLVIVGGAAVVCAGYEHRQKVFDWWNEMWETREYEQYVRVMTEKHATDTHRHQKKSGNNDTDDDDDDDDDDDGDLPLLHYMRQRLQGKGGNVLRKRSDARAIHQSNMDGPCSVVNTRMQADAQECTLLEMERIVEERKADLRREELRLFEAEQVLERGRLSLQSRGNSIMGIMDQENDSSLTANLFADRSMHVVPTNQSWAERAGEVHGPSDSEESWDRLERSSHGSRSSNQSWIKATK